jgi:hypothetical protein
MIGRWFEVQDEQFTRFLQESRPTAQRTGMYFHMQEGHKALLAVLTLVRGGLGVRGIISLEIVINLDKYLACLENAGRAQCR